MTKTYYTYGLRIGNNERVQVEKWDGQHQNLGQPSGLFRYQEKLEEIAPLLAIAREGQLNDSGKARALGETLFDILFDDVLRQDFVNFYDRVVQQEKQLLRVELDIDERLMPEVAALPWEFLCLPEKAHLGTIWMGTVPDLAFSRRRSQWIAAKPIQLERDDKLKIALVVSAPPDLSPVAYEPVQKALEKLASEGAERVELLPIINSANPEEIDSILSQEPHIFHFIGHGRLEKEGDREVGQVALVDPDFDEAMWVEADYFSGLFNRHRPGVVVLQACESGMLSESQAFVGVASSIVEQNIPVVLAMQYEVTNSTASRFARSFYEKLAADKPVDIAAQEGRYTIAKGPTQYRKRDFATPVIFMRVQDGYLFKRENGDNNNNLDFSNHLQLTKQEQELSILSDPSPNLEGLHEQQNTKLILPSVPEVKSFEFTTVTVDYRGIDISRYQGQAKFAIEDLGNGVTLEMVVVPGGEFLMGSPDSASKQYPEEKPQNSVTTQPFLMSKYPITKAQWREIARLPEVRQKLKTCPSRLGGKNHPVTRVSWYDAVEFCDRLSQKTDREYRLPSEAEWEYACRAGTTTPFHFGETITTNLANYDGKYPYASEPTGINRQKTTPVGDFKVANKFGLFDMHGNVWEWCLDSWHENYDGAPTNGDEWLDSENKNRVMRGGSFVNEAFKCRSSYRFHQRKNEGFKHVGFRIILRL